MRLSHSVSAVVLAASLAAASGPGKDAGGRGCTPEQIETLRAAAERGVASAQADLGIFLAEGRCVKQDLAQAVRWLELSAGAGYLDAKFTLGMMYLQGEGVSPDPSMATAQLMEAAQGGHARAQYAVGSLYASGRGFVKNRIQAYKWISLSMKGDDEHTRAVLETLAKKMTREEVAAAVREAGAWRAAHKG